MAPNPRRLVLGANAAWNIANFRAGLIRGLREAGYSIVALTPPDPRADSKLAELGVERITIGIDRSGLNPIADFRLMREYRRILAQVRPAAFLGFTVKPNIYGSLAASSLRIPVLANVSGLGTAFLRGGPLQALVTLLYRLAFRRADTVFFQNPDDQQLFMRRKIVRAEQARLLPGSGIDLDHFAQAPLPDGPPTFLLIARLLRDKGVREFVEAAGTVRRDCPQCRFQLLGGLDPGNRTSITRAELDSWSDSGIVEHLGEADDVRPFIAQSTAVVLPSYREGLPRSLLEAAAMGRPLVTTDVPGCRELVQDGVNGVLCAVRNSASLAGAMRRMSDLPHDRLCAMGAASRAMAEERFSERLVVRAYLDALAMSGEE